LGVKVNSKAPPEKQQLIWQLDQTLLGQSVGRSETQTDKPATTVAAAKMYGYFRADSFHAYALIWVK
jgi:hypothetical protein